MYIESAHESVGFYTTSGGYVDYWAYTGGHEYGSRRKKYVVHYTSDVDEIFEHIKREDKPLQINSCDDNRR